MRFANPGHPQSKPPLERQEHDPSQENFGLSALTHCLVDADSAATRGTGRARRKALGVSALVQFCTIAAILIVPLFATGSRLILRPTNFVPLPPYGGPSRHDAANPPRTSVPPRIDDRRPRFEVPQVQAPTRIPPKVQEITDDVPNTGSGLSKSPIGLQGSGSSAGPLGILIGDGPGPQPPRPDPIPVTPPRRPISVSQGVELALLTHRVEPIYPTFARQMHKEGTVELRATISAEGEVKDVQILSGDPMLAKAARDAVSQWRFRPTMLNGVAVEVVTFITVNFHIGQ